MAVLIGTISVYFSQPWWLLAGAAAMGYVWLLRRSLASLGPVRRWLAMVFRCLTFLLLVALLAQPKLVKENRHLSVIVVLDRSQSIPSELREASLDYLSAAMENQDPLDRLGVIDIAEAAGISKLPSGDKKKIRERNTTLQGNESKLSDGVQMALAIAPPDTAVRILLVSDGNETGGDLKEIARIAGANNIPIDVLPLRYRYANEVVFRRLAAPAQVRKGGTVSLRFILDSTSHVSGRLVLTLNGRAVDMDPTSAEVGVAVDLKPGTNVQTISLPVGLSGMHEYEAVFIPDDARKDRVAEKNRASTMVYVAGPGRVLVVDADGSARVRLTEALQRSSIDAQSMAVEEFPDDLARLMDIDAVILANIESSHFTF